MSSRLTRVKNEIFTFSFHRQYTAIFFLLLSSIYLRARTYTHSATWYVARGCQTRWSDMPVATCGFKRNRGQLNSVVLESVKWDVTISRPFEISCGAPSFLPKLSRFEYKRTAKSRLWDWKRSKQQRSHPPNPWLPLRLFLWKPASHHHPRDLLNPLTERNK